MTTHFIDNRRVAAIEGGHIDVIDPSDGAPFAQLARGDIQLFLMLGNLRLDLCRLMMATFNAGRVVSNLALQQVFFDGG